MATKKKSTGVKSVLAPELRSVDLMTASREQMSAIDVAVRELVKRSGAKKVPKPKRKQPKWMADYPRAKRALQKYRHEIMQLPGVKGVSIGARYKNGQRTRQIAIRLQVANQRAKNYLRRNADKVAFKKAYGGIDTDIVVWKFASSSGAGMQDGDCIQGDGGGGTLGTTVIREMASGAQKAVWFTAGHVASNFPPAPPANIRPCGGTVIGTVDAGDWFRDSLMDIAFIDPSTHLSQNLPPRVIGSIDSSHVNATVRITGAKNTGTGIIDSVDFAGELTSGEDVIHHFTVKFNGDHGDSRALITLNGFLIGILRAVNGQGLVAAAKLDIAAGATGFFV